MGRATSEKVGRGTCPSCGEPVTYRKSLGGMLTHKCDSCDSSGYAEPGGAAFKARMLTIKNPEAAPAPAATAAAAPAKPKREAFSLGNL